MIQILISFFYLPGVSFGQWQEDFRLTNDNLESITSLNNAKCIVSSNKDVHVVWASGTSGDWDVFYKRSTDEGITWGSNFLITNDPGNDGSFDPCIAVYGNIVCVAWTDLRYRPNWEIFFKRSTDGGISWGSNVRLVNGSSMSRNPSIAVSDSIVHLVWYEAGFAYYMRSTDKGINWNSGIQLSNSELTSGDPSISVSGSDVHTVWSENNEIYYSHSADEGVSWETDVRLTNDAANSWCPSVSVSGQNLGVVWYDLRDGNYEIYFKRSSNGGATWEADIRLSNGPYASYNPSVYISGSIVHVAWYEVYYDYKLYYKKSLNGGQSWGTDELLPNSTAASFNPFLSASDSVIHVIWYDLRHSSSEIYYKRNPTGNSLFALNLTAVIEGFYNSSSNTVVSDTAKIILRNNVSPFSVIDSSVSVLNATGTGVFYFSGINNGVDYYIVFKHRNSIETWSSSGNSFTNGALTYNFSDGASKAFGNNLKQVDVSPVRFAVFSGDVNQDGFIDLADVILISNDASSFVTGYVNTDVTGNNISDLTDVIIAYNNSANFVSVLRP